MPSKGVRPAEARFFVKGCSPCDPPGTLPVSNVFSSWPIWYPLMTQCWIFFVIWTSFQRVFALRMEGSFRRRVFALRLLEDILPSTGVRPAEARFFVNGCSPCDLPGTLPVFKRVFKPANLVSSNESMLDANLSG